MNYSIAPHPEQRSGDGHAILTWLRERNGDVRLTDQGLEISGLELSDDYQERLSRQVSAIATALQEETAGWVHVWDMGLLCRWFYAPGGAATAAMQFTAYVRSMSAGVPHVILALDSTVPTWRHQLFPAYKANRPQRAPEEIEALNKQRDASIEMLPRAYAIRSQGWEADDVCATVATFARTDGYRVKVFSADKDLLQLLPQGIRIHNGQHDVTSVDVLRKFSVRADQIVDYLAIVGDSSDGLPGIKGLGPKAAVALLSKYQTFEHALAEAKIQFGMTDNPSASLQRFVDGEQEGRLTRKLVSLDRNAPLLVPWKPKEG